jgi:hypothetical protein
MSFIILMSGVSARYIPRELKFEYIIETISNNYESD